jgi:hypothetical protein
MTQKAFSAHPHPEPPSIRLCYKKKAERIEQLQVGTAYIQTPEMPYGSLVHMYPLEER